MKETITQFVLIVFSVVLGLYLSERIEEGKKKRESEELLATIKSELKDNISLMEDWVPYHIRINKNLDSLSKEPVFIEAFIENKYIMLEQLMTRGSFMKSFPTNDAWDIAKSHPLIVNIDYDKLLILSRVYSHQENAFEPGFKMFELFESKDVNTPEDAAINLELMSNHLHELVARERDVIYFYGKAAEILDLSDEEENEE